MKFTCDLLIIMTSLRLVINITQTSIKMGTYQILSDRKKICHTQTADHDTLDCKYSKQHRCSVQTVTIVQETVELRFTRYPYLLRVTSYLVAWMVKNSRKMRNACLLFRRQITMLERFLNFKD